MHKLIRTGMIVAALAAAVLQMNAAHAQMSESDVVVRMERLENHVRQLTGTIEQLQFRNQQLEQQLKRSQEDAEYRFQESGGRGGAPRSVGAVGGGGSAASGAPVAQPAQPGYGQIPPSAPAPVASAAPVHQGAPTQGRRSDAFDPTQNPGAPGAPQTLGSMRASGPPPVISSLPDDDDVGVPGGRSAGQPLDISTLSERAANGPYIEPRREAYPMEPRREAYPSAPTPPGAIRQVGPSPVIASAPPPDNSPLPAPPLRNPSATGAIPGNSPQQMTMAPSATPRDEFALAQGYIQRKDYALAEDSFRAFLKKYPSDRMVGDAQYWLGESMFQRQKYRDAAESFLNVSTNHAQAAKAPEALLRLGQSLAALGEREAACATLSEVGRKYPKASNGVRQGVDREQKRAKC